MNKQSTVLVELKYWKRTFVKKKSIVSVKKNKKLKLICNYYSG